MLRRAEAKGSLRSAALGLLRAETGGSARGQRVLRMLPAIAERCASEEADAYLAAHGPLSDRGLDEWLHLYGRGAVCEHLTLAAVRESGGGLEVVRTLRVSGGAESVTPELAGSSGLLGNTDVRRVIIAHSHPDGESAPSLADIEAFRCLKRTFASAGASLTGAGEIMRAAEAIADGLPGV